METVGKIKHTGSWKHSLFAILAAMIWGLGFSAQSMCLSAGLGTSAINALRGWIAVLVLGILVLIFAGPKKTRRQIEQDGQTTRGYMKKLIAGGALCGCILFIATTAQQLGIAGTTTGKSGFITALYIVLVPAFGGIFHKKVGIRIWISVLIALVGMFLLCFDPSEELVMNQYDLCLLVCAFLFTGHIYAIDYYTQYVNGMHLSLFQFFFYAAVGTIVSLITEQTTGEMILKCFPMLLYLGAGSSGLAYTLQILAQKGNNPTVITVLLSLESVFAAVGGALFLHEVLSIQEYIGCIVMMAAVLLAQFPSPKSKSEKEV